jgi:hypothetical protein
MCSFDSDFTLITWTEREAYATLQMALGLLDFMSHVATRLQAILH